MLISGEVWNLEIEGVLWDLLSTDLDLGTFTGVKIDV